MSDGAGGPVPFAMIGAGWRAEFYLRIAAALPDGFRVTGVMTRDPARGARVRAGWDVPTHASLDEAIADRPAFVVLCVLLRRYLDAGFADVTITARRFASPIVEGPGRDGAPPAERVVVSDQVLAWFDFGDRLGVYDFTPDQYFSWIRSPRVLIRGERGEINGTPLRRLLDATTPVTVELVRRDTGQDGNLEGLHHAGITAGEAWVYRDPFAPARLADDEIAVATCLARMAEHVEGGPGFCSLAEGAWDHELTLRTAEAFATGKRVHVSGAAWA